MATETYGPNTQAWHALALHAEALRKRSIRSLYDGDAARFTNFSAEACGFVLDYSRQLLDRRAIDLLIALAAQTDVEQWIQRMFAGYPVNNTEDRPALHVALRRDAAEALVIDGEDVMALVENERMKMRALADTLHRGELKGYTGRPITTVVNIGIGGSDLGVAMAVIALAEYRQRALAVHFVSNVDGVALDHTLDTVDPETTLFVICSKSFTTLETLVNARAVRAWLLERGGPAAVAAQCVAVSTNDRAMDEFGIAADRRLAIWDWVGGRYSVWSAVGLVVALAIGWPNFAEFLQGGREMDAHFRAAPLSANLPVLLALVGVWNRNFLDAASHAVLPYDDHLARLPAFLQQLEMESNGKSVRRGGEPVGCRTCPILWGEPGSNGQHSFYQLLHQGTERVSIDFLLPARSSVSLQAQHDLAAANCLAQAWALADGDPQHPAGTGQNPHLRYPGNKPSTLLMFEALTPRALGSLVALYEHKVFVQGVIWDVNSFDQWGVQLGKRLASKLMAAVSGAVSDASLPRTISDSIARLRAWQRR